MTVLKQNKKNQVWSKNVSPNRPIVLKDNVDFPVGGAQSMNDGAWKIHCCNM